MNVWKCRGIEIDLTIPKIMGIVNVTPDSFSDGGVFSDSSSAIEYANKIALQGADIIDIGGESTRPGASQVDTDEEQRRVLPVIKGLKNAVVSIDTYHAPTAEKAIEAGALIINSVVPLKDFNDPLAKIASQTGAGLVLTHNVDDGKNSPEDVFEFLQRQIDYAIRAGCLKEQLVIDVGFGFSKTREEDLVLISSLSRFSSLAPLLVGLSRKRTLDYVLNPSNNGAGTKPDERIGASVAAAAWCAMNGASILRVHDVKDTLQAILVSRMFFEISKGK
ncbi:MAG: dihydropteroate synthase [Kiritimatiellae bacterium]|nr:dihydropteroate synthase [Kiritimatiellia bacterium]